MQASKAGTTRAVAGLALCGDPRYGRTEPIRWADSSKMSNMRTTMSSKKERDVKCMICEQLLFNWFVPRAAVFVKKKCAGSQGSKNIKFYTDMKIFQCSRGQASPMPANPVQSRKAQMYRENNRAQTNTPKQCNLSHRPVEE